MITPIPGMAFVIEDKEELVSKDSKLAELGFLQANQRNVGVSGTVYEVNESHLCGECGKKCQKIGLKKGDRVIYSKFIAEQIEFEGMKDLRSVPVSGILAVIS